MLIVTFGIFFIYVKAQSISLNNDEIKKLQQLILADSSAAKQFSFLQKTADSALNDSAHAIETLATEGRLKGDPKKTATVNAVLDMNKMYALAIVYRVKNDSAYLKKAISFLKMWAIKNHPTGNPVDENNVEQAFITYDLIKNKLSQNDKTLTEQWFRKIAKAEMSYWKMPKGVVTSYNNWNSHRLKTVGEIAWCLNDSVLKKYVIENLKIQLYKNLNADSTTFDFDERDALHYHCYDLVPLIKLSIIIKRNEGIDFYNYTTEKNASIAKCVAFLLPFMNGEKTHVEFAHTKVSFDNARAKNHEKGFENGTIFHPADGLRVISFAAYFDASLIEIVRKLKIDDERFPDWQSVMNEVVR
jgi:hypothetical protein